VQIGMIGLGRMGGNMARRLMHGGHQVVAHATDLGAVREIAHEGARGATSLDELVEGLAPPRAVWLMVPAGAVTERLVTDLAKRLAEDDVIIDGGNTFYKDDVRRAASLARQASGYVDVGTSGGSGGLERGCCLMIGGAPEVAARLDPMFRTLVPASARCRGRRVARRSAERPSRAISTAGRWAPVTS
jgi:6-phosphogluconate dehydrogenase